jgi:hypothetical protein
LHMGKSQVSMRRREGPGLPLPCFNCLKT